GGGKIESVIGTVQRELLEVVHFDSVVDAERALATFFADNNHRRAHLGIGSLVPADRFYGRWPEVVAEMTRPAGGAGARSRSSSIGDCSWSHAPPVSGWSRSS